MKKIRSVILQGITVPVRVNHAHLAAQQRIDATASRIDILRTEVEVQTGYIATAPRSLRGVWNYGEVYSALCQGDVRTITGPLEGVLDDALGAVQQSARNQELELSYARVAAQRMGLAVGFPHLQASIGTPSSVGAGDTRYAGICDFPLVLNIDHSWCSELERVEHADLRTESVNVSFGAFFERTRISESDLSGLYNYASLVHSIASMHGLHVTGPMEELCDLIAGELEADAARACIPLVASEVRVRRTGYARCTPVISLVTDYRA